MNKAMQVFIGSMFGDGNIFLNKEKYLSYSEIHSLKQKDYLLWKMKFMSKMFNFANSPYIFNKYDKRTKKRYPTIKINSSDSNKLSKYYLEFYKNKRKVVPINFLYKMDKIGLAIWYQDDGTYHYGNYTCSIATDNFTKDENELIQKFLSERFQIESVVCNKYGGHYLFFNRKNTDRFLRLIQENIHKSMLYKIGHLHNSNISKIKKSKNVISKNKKEYYFNNQDKISDYQKKYRKINSEKIKQYSLKYYIKNKEKIKEQHKGYYHKNKEKILTKNKEYREKNKEEINKRRRLKKHGTI